MSQPNTSPRQIKLRVPPFVGSLLERLFSASTVRVGATV